jgi:hypothetical protein
VKESVPAKTTPEAASLDDWKQLSPSTLQRKTVKVLTEYLVSKVCHDAGRLEKVRLYQSHKSFFDLLQGASVTDTDGTTLKKNELLEAVRSL